VAVYLFSKEYINNVIAFPFDFSDEELLAYCISFLEVSAPSTPFPFPTSVPWQPLPLPSHYGGSPNGVLSSRARFCFAPPSEGPPGIFPALCGGNRVISMKLDRAWRHFNYFPGGEAGTAYPRAPL